VLITLPLAPAYEAQGFALGAFEGFAMGVNPTLP
jgi:hypothetical protein